MRSFETAAGVQTRGIRHLSHPAGWREAGGRASGNLKVRPLVIIELLLFCSAGSLVLPSDEPLQFKIKTSQCRAMHWSHLLCPAGTIPHVARLPELASAPGFSVARGYTSCANLRVMGIHARAAGVCHAGGRTSVSMLTRQHPAAAHPRSAVQCDETIQADQWAAGWRGISK